MAFLRGLWKVLVAVKDGLVLILLLIFFGTLHWLLTVTPHGGGPTEGALVLRIDGPVVEQPAEVSPFSQLSGDPRPHEYRLAEIVNALDEAGRDDRIQAVALDLDIFAGGRQATLGDVGAALDRFRRTGKKVLAYATGYDDDTYQLAAHADEVWINPLGAILLSGPGGTNLYYGQLLQRLGITAHVYRVGAFKSAVEPYTRSDMSPEARQANQALADTLWAQWRDEVRRARPRAQVDAYAAAPGDAVTRAGGDMAQAAQAMGLVDRIGDRDAFSARMAQLVGDSDEAPGFRAVAFDNFRARNPIEQGNGNVGILTVAGEIGDGNSSGGTVGPDTIVPALEEAMRERGLRALVVRIDSPGGSVLGSERIRQAIQNVRGRGVPVIVSMGSLAASGGYWIATAGDRIFAEPGTITGSIGVFAVLPSFEGALQKLGIGADGVRTTAMSGQPDLLRGIAPDADRLLQMGIDSTYRRFIGLVAQARHLPAERVNEIAQGRVWDGGTARQIGLVDQFGNLQDAVAEASRRAGIDASDVRATFIEPKPGWWSRWFGTNVRLGTASTSRDPFARLALRSQAVIGRAMEDARRLAAGSAIQARCLECPAAYDWAPSGDALSWWRLLLGVNGGQ
jgi:protease IV